eukprot:UN11243
MHQFNLKFDKTKNVIFKGGPVQNSPKTLGGIFWLIWRHYNMINNICDLQ